MTQIPENVYLYNLKRRKNFDVWFGILWIVKTNQDEWQTKGTKFGIWDRWYECWGPLPQPLSLNMRFCLMLTLPDVST